MKKVLAPPHIPMPHELLFPVPGVPNWKVLRDHLTREGKLSKSDILEMISLFQAQLKSEPNYSDTRPCYCCWRSSWSIL